MTAFESLKHDLKHTVCDITVSQSFQNIGKEKDLFNYDN